jgi:3-mercaptopropionate dioxygenase
MEQLIAAIDAAVHDDLPVTDRVEAVAAVMRDTLVDRRLLSAGHRRSSSESYRTNIVHIAADGSFSVVALVWLPGQRTPIHTHRSWCVVGVYEGQELETTYRLSDRPEGAILESVAIRSYRQGDVTWLTSERDIHRVEHAGDVPAVSLHVYGIDYRRYPSSILDVLDLPVAESCRPRGELSIN